MSFPFVVQRRTSSLPLSVTDLLYEGTKLANYVCFNDGEYCLQRVASVVPKKGGILKRYNEEAVDFHIHAALHDLVREVGDHGVCIRVEYAVELKDATHFTGASADQFHPRIYGSGCSEIDEFVLISIRQPVEFSEQFSFISPRTWLQSIDDCVRLLGHPSQAAVSLSLPGLRFSETGKARAGVVCNGNPQMIKRRTRVMHYVTSRDTEWERRLDEEIELNPNAALFSIEMGRKFCNLKPKVGRNLSLKYSEMLIGPDDFCVNSGQSIL